MNPKFFKSPSAFRKWLEAYHSTAQELWVGFYKKDSGKPGSIWSAVNMRNAERLIKEGRMRSSGLKAYQARKENRSGIYSYEQRSPELVEPYATEFKRNKAAWKFFEAQPPYYRKTMNWWVVSAKQEETRLKRLTTLIEASAEGRRLR